MAIKRCEYGHFYNDKESASCPYCPDTSALGNTIPLDDGNKPEPIPLITPKEPIGDLGGILPPEPETKPKPVVGWLVVIEGKKKGTDFKIHKGENCIGRGASNDIQIDFDYLIPDRNACLIAYDDVDTMFYIGPRSIKAHLRLNGKIVVHNEELKDRDILQIGKTKLMLRTFCDQDFDYADDGDDGFVRID